MTQEKFEKRFKTLDFSKTKDAWGNEIYAHSHIQAKWEGWDAALAQPSICKDGLPKLTQENPYVTQPKADVDTLMKDVYAAYENDDDSHKKSTVAWVIDHLAAQGYIGEWRPIECAPKDGEYFLVCLPRMMNLIMRARFDTVHKQWLSERDNDGAISRVEFFHAGDFWMPMPKPPAAPKKEEKHE
jgi:hypothetical protein